MILSMIPAAIVSNPLTLVRGLLVGISGIIRQT